MNRVALATDVIRRELSDDDRLLLPALTSLGVSAVPAVWNDPAVDWQATGAVVVRSCWDYHLQAGEFHGWIDRLEAAGVPLLNPPALLRWNLEKTYLRELAERGVPVVPTRWVEQKHAASLREILDDTGWRQVVIKPSISASAFETWLVSAPVSSDDDARFQALAARGRVLVQPFVSEVAIEGEWSLVFFSGEFSHAVLKQPRDGDFRVQQEHGGRSLVREPSASLEAEAASALAAATRGSACAYARVDGCVVDGRFLLMELELIEPYLFLGSHPEAPNRFARAIAASLR